MGNLERRKLWKTGKGTYVTSFPAEWVVPLIDRYGEEVVLSHGDERILVLPAKKIDNLHGKVKLEKSDPHLKLESEIVAAYIANYDSVFVEIPKEKSYVSGKILGLIHKLESTSIERRSSNKFLITFFSPKTSILSLLDSNYSQYKELFKQINESMDSFPSHEDELMERRGIFTALECEVDKRTFQAKRLLNSVLSYPWRLAEIGLRNLADILQYSLLASSVERLCDLEEELFDQIVRLTTKYRETGKELRLSTPSEKYDFKRYHQDAHGIVNAAYENRENPNKLYEIIKMKRNFDKGIEYKFNAFSSEKRDYITAFIEKNTKYSRLLTIMEQEVWGLFGIASNISEAGTNVRRPKLLSLEQFH